MKTKKVLIFIVSIILMSIPITSLAWLPPGSTYIAPNKINLGISAILSMTAFVVCISYITMAMGYLRVSDDEGKQKAKNIFMWLIITIMQVTILVIGAYWVKEIGMEKYLFPSRERYQTSALSGYISSGLRLTALASILIYIIKGIRYYFKSEEETKNKVIKLAKWQLALDTIVVILLICAKNF